MSTAHLYQDYQPGVPSTHPTVSFELYPPRAQARTSSVWTGINRLIDAAPDYVSVTFGAGGAKGDSRDRSVQVLMNVLDQRRKLPAVAHLTCLGSTRGDMAMIIRLLLRAGIRDFLALRGDPPSKDLPLSTEVETMTRAVDLVYLIREIEAEVLDPDRPEDRVSIAVAAYPASSGQARANDIAALLEKQRAGADYAITQVFYDPAQYDSMVRELTLAGGRLPLIPGIMPLNDLRRLEALERLSGVPVPQRIVDIHRNPDDSLRVWQSLKATIELIAGVLEAGAPGIHLYTFNRPRPVLDVVEYLRGGGYLNRYGSTGGTSRMPLPPDVDVELVGLALRRLTPGV
ncbi:5,10-methylenetetrahydrofolate reductase [Corynebacterium poyangense]|uniref:Methylenetetrahydrofolate reductase n=1 Tax=Corynebacterium poyangense TaxID=2684405 RepID=A0A7H0SNX9_9CORY|nr:methylenetetrahydrofolate reductase [Corynebacterium poyangense]MBZ8177815.1 5,10-methylenetetrahydrofolate reductase [Corynebacterium poyangense]QNQ90254.1 5,10-methylenetetrahydrofolate reductase [Corynebacterium poyangense]